MQTGDIVIVSFPYTDLVSFKARPAVVVAMTKDVYDDIIIALITSVLTTPPSAFQFKIQADNYNHLRADSIVKVNRLATVEKNKIIAAIGRLATADLKKFKDLFKSLVEE